MATVKADLINSQVIAYNLEKLHTRKRGQKFYVDSQGRLADLTGFRKFLYLFFRCYVHEVRKAITAVVRQLDPTKTDLDLQKLFFKTLSPLSPKIFDRSAISDSVEEILMPSLQGAKAALKTVKEQKESSKKLQRLITRLHYQVQLRSVKLAIKLGIDLKLIPGGSSGVYLGRNRNGDRVLAFKPDDEGPYGPNNPKWKTRVRNSIQGCLGFKRTSLQGHPESQAEIWASQVDRYLGLDVVPTTKRVTFESAAFRGAKKKSGSAQLWVNQATEAAAHAASFRGLFYWPCRRRVPVSTKEFENLVILDFVTGNQDRDTDNWLIKRNGKVVAFDNGLAFPHLHPRNWMSTRKQYMWSGLLLAERRFSASTTKLITKKLGSEKALEKLFATVKGLTEKQKARMKDRIAVLKHYATSRKTIRQLAAIKTPDHFAAFFRTQKTRC